MIDHACAQSAPANWQGATQLFDANVQDARGDEQNSARPINIGIRGSEQGAAQPVSVSNDRHTKVELIQIYFDTTVEVWRSVCC